MSLLLSQTVLTAAAAAVAAAVAATVANRPGHCRRRSSPTARHSSSVGRIVGVGLCRQFRRRATTSDAVDATSVARAQNPADLLPAQDDLAVGAHIRLFLLPVQPGLGAGAHIRLLLLPD